MAGAAAGRPPRIAAGIVTILTRPAAVGYNPRPANARRGNPSAGAAFPLSRDTVSGGERAGKLTRPAAAGASSSNEGQ
jgi:hypothetical protein